MGLNCCTASTKDDKEPPAGDGAHTEEISQQRNNTRHSSPLFRRNNRTHIEDVILSPIGPPAQRDISSFNGSETKNNVTDRSGIASGSGSSGVKSANLGKISRKFRLVLGQDNNSSPSTSSQEAASKSQQEKWAQSSTKAHTSNSSSSSKNRSKSSDKIPSIKSSRSPNKSTKTHHPQSDTSSTITKSPLSQIASQDSPNSEGSGWNPETNHWTCETFNELVASSKGAKSSSNNQIIDYIRADSKSPSNDQIVNYTRADSKSLSNNQIVDYIRADSKSSPNNEILDHICADTSNIFSFDGPALDAQLCCNICTRPLKEKSPLGRKKIWDTTNELRNATVLYCGHVFHEDCLEKMTHEIDTYDPQCPLCMHGKKHVAKMLKKIESELKKDKKMKSDQGLVSAYKTKISSVYGSTTPLNSFSLGECSKKNPHLFAKFRY